MQTTLTQKLNILKSNKDFISYNLNNENKIESFVLNNNFRRYSHKYDNFMLLDIFKNHYILESKQNYTLKQILINLNILNKWTK